MGTASPSAAANAARALLAQGASSEAAQAVEEACRQFPGHSGLEALQDRIRRSRGEHAASLEKWRAVVRADRGHVLATVRMIVSLARLGRFDEAREELARAPFRSPLDPALAKACQTLAVCVARTGRVEEADALYDTPPLFAGSIDQEVLYQRLVLRTRFCIERPDSGELFAKLMSFTGPQQPRNLLLKARFDWEMEGASEGLAERFLQAHALAGADAASHAPDGICLLLELGRTEDVRALLAAHPAVLEEPPCRLPLALLAVEMPSFAALPQDRQAAWRRLATLARGLLDSEARLRSLFPPELRAAVVGNSPCETGRGRGRSIDAHDLVVRFNRFSTAPQHQADYGSRTDVVVRLAQVQEALHAAAAPHAHIIFSGNNRFYRGCEWEAPLRHLEEGKAVYLIPSWVHRELIPRLGGSPSGGLSFSWWLARTQGRAERNSFFGFAFVDQTGPNATSAHYFEQSTPSFRHKWDRELEVFQSLFT